MGIAEVLARFPDAKKTGKGWTARCPAHDDRNPSLSIGEVEGGKVLMKCHAGCRVEDILAAVGLTMGDLFPAGNGNGLFRPALQSTSMKPSKPRNQGRSYPSLEAAIKAQEPSTGGYHAGTWRYYRADGEETFAVARFNIDGPPESDGKAEKTFRPFHRTSRGWASGDPEGLLPLYRLPDLSEASRVYVVEGEKAADAARSIELAGTTSGHGAQSAARADWSPLAGKEVIILPDNDVPGFKYAEDVAAILHRLSSPARVKIVELPDLPDHGDIVEFLETRDAHSAEEVRAEVEALADQSEVIKPERAGREVEPFQPFPVNVLPEPVRSFIEMGAEAHFCDPIYIALPLLAALASAIGTSRRIRLKRTWAEPAVIWGLIIGASGTVKSPVLELAFSPVRKRQREAFEKFRKDKEEFERASLEYDRDLASWKKRPGGRPPEKQLCPSAQRFIVSDITVEGLAAILRDNPRGVLLARDEFAGWIRSFDSYRGGKGGDVDHWLEMHGARDLTVDRKTGDVKTIHVPRAAVSITGGIQLGTLRVIMKPEFFENGLAARILMAYPPRVLKRWTEAEIPQDLEERVFRVFGQLWSLSPNLDGEGNPYPVDIPLDSQAAQTWKHYFNDHAKEGEDLAGALAAASAKLEGCTARLALVIHFLRWAAGDPTLPSPEKIDEESIQAGIILSRWFEDEARRVYGILGESESQGERRELVELIGRKGGGITVRGLQQYSRRFRGREEKVLDELVKVGMGTWEDLKPRRGPSSREFRLASDVYVYRFPPSSEGKLSKPVDVDSVDGGEVKAGEEALR
jgi:hypothetical protein